MLNVGDWHRHLFILSSENPLWNNTKGIVDQDRWWSQPLWFMDSTFVSPTCYSLFVTPKSMLPGLLKSLADTCRGQKMWVLSSGSALPSCFSSHTKNKHPFCGLLNATFFTFLCFLRVVLLFKLAPKPSAKVLPGVPKHRRAVVY